MENSQTRAATHAGSWYQHQRTYSTISLAEALKKELDGYLGKASTIINNIKSIKAIIGPHAGYKYSGPVAAFGYKYLAQFFGIN